MNEIVYTSVPICLPRNPNDFHSVIGLISNISQVSNADFVIPMWQWLERTACTVLSMVGQPFRN